MTTFRQDIRLGKKVPLMNTDDYSDQSVTTEKLADKSVTDKKVADGAISTSNIKDSSITSKKLADGSITTTKLSDKSITTEKIADNAIGTAHIKSNAVTSEKLDDQAVLISKIAGEVWEKLKDEYLRLDGMNEMKGNINAGFHTIYNITRVCNVYGLHDVRSLDLDDPYYDLLLTLTRPSNEDGTTLLGVKDGEANFFENSVMAKGYKTSDRTNIGLLVNDGTVGLAMTDSDIDAITSSVFTNYVNND